MAAGKTSTGGVANAGQMSWAKAQLAKIPDPNIGIKSVGTTTSQTTNSGTAGLEPVKTDPIPNPAATTTINPASTQAADYQAWKAKQDDLFAKLEGLSNSQFSYDPNTDPAYQAQRDLAKLRAGDANRATMETMNDRGLLQSTVTNSQLDQNNQRAEQEAAAYIPQYREQAYGQFRDRLSNAANLLGIASNRGDTAYERDYQTGRDATGDALNEAQLTGVYQSPEARQQIDALLELKRQAEAPEITAEQRAGLSKQADGIRSRLTTMGVDIAKLGANTNSSNANAAAGVQTLAAKNQEFNQGITMAELTGKLPDGTATTAEQQRKLQNEWMAADKTGVISPMLANLYGLKAGSPTRAAKEFAQQLAISQQNANTSAYSAQTSRDSLDWSKDPNNPDNQGKATDTSKYFDQLSSMYVAKDPDSGAPMVTNPTALRAAIIGLSLDDANTDKLLLQFGLQPN